MHADSVGQGGVAELTACVLPDPIKRTEAEPVRSCMPVCRMQQACISLAIQVVQPHHGILECNKERLFT